MTAAQPELSPYAHAFACARATPISVAWAMRYANAGLHPIQLAPAVHGEKRSGKNPVEAAWQTRPLDLEALCSALERAPTSNLGLRMGLQPDGETALVALDVDDMASAEAVRTELGDLPETLRTATGRGLHLICRVPVESLPQLTNFTRRSGIDLRAEGAQVVAAPSIHFTGGHYSTVIAPPTELPQAWLDWLIANSRPKATAASPDGTHACPAGLARDDRWLEHARADLARLPPAVEGEGGGKLYQAACIAMRGWLLPRDTAEDLLLEDGGYNDRCEPPWSSDNAEHKANWDRTMARADGGAPSTIAWGSSRPTNISAAGVRHAKHPDESAAAAAAVGMPQDETGLRLCAATAWPWIVQSGDQFWLHTQPGAYSNPWRASELIASVARELSGFLPAEVMNLKDLRLNWIRPARHVRASYIARAHTYDPATNSMLTAALEWMPSDRARKHEHVDRWLRALWGEAYDAGAQWLSSCAALDRPAPLLYMIGEKELGKSLLVDGLAPLWGCVMVPPMSSAIDEFNACAGSCPLAFADEGLPEKLTFNRFRSMITEHSREINRKGLAKTVVEGCARYVVSANNREVLRWQRMGVLTPDDQAAIAARMLVIECRNDARALLAELGKDMIDAMASAQIAEHVLWLAATVDLEPRGQRMAAKPHGGQVLLTSVVDNRHSEVLTFLGQFLEPGSSQLERDHAGVAATEDQIRVRPAKLGAAMRATGSRVTDADVREACRAYASVPDAVVVRGTRYKALDRQAVGAALARLDA